ncbi:TetR/AcrR family transcriptional regulator [Phytomonospora endophytica]|uniref:AcrR family transcriptional regulator n=1 Tax=Phytomonospora endophytica TaxID=714109 RepID=A0A841FJW3_9ACTN|nr:TetR/AcrR family transcriptional regulator [Phytomonospora endophytica]MBB6037611.1 AcrR family transcriptional regulator [Phytomonospora endophytica]GIG67864.1 TetR family transcriptional regulator [Phytomonospora endophytica]
MVTKETANRKERERAERRARILAEARALAEAEGWDAVTTRRLARQIEYSQPVLYSHFANKEAIVTAVALEGIAELGRAMREARCGETDPAGAMLAVAYAYQDFADANPALFEAIFTLPTALEFGGPASPPELIETFKALVDTFAPLAADRDVETFTEMAWSAMHGQVVLDRGGRLRPPPRRARMKMLMDTLAGRPCPPTG